MEQRAKLKDDIGLNKNLKLLTRAYQEHAIQQINFARFTVLGTRDFSEELKEIFFNVKSSYKRALEIAERHGRSLSRKKNGKQVLVLVTANNKLYGELIPKICQLFFKNAKESPQADLIVIGKQGKEYLAEAKLNRPYLYFNIPDTKVTLDYIQPLAAKLVEYEAVIVFCGKFNNLASQEPIKAHLTGDLLLEDKEETSQEDYVFEPDLEEILTFFESQIFSLILNQTIQEAQLARFAARIQAMEAAQTNLQRWLEKLVHQERKLRSSENSKKQLAQIAGRALWGKR